MRLMILAVLTATPVYFRDSSEVSRRRDQGQQAQTPAKPEVAMAECF